MFNFLKKKKEPENLEEILAELRALKRDSEKISKELESLKRENMSNFQKFGLVRFNPFKEMGSNQSFSLCLLDGQDNGIVLTSLYGKEGNRVYGKPLKGGKSEYLLSDEEKKAIEYAKEKSRDENI